MDARDNGIVVFHFTCAKEHFTCAEKDNAIVAQDNGMDGRDKGIVVFHFTIAVKRGTGAAEPNPFEKNLSTGQTEAVGGSGGRRLPLTGWHGVKTFSINNL